jgi:hypothetical protein
MTTLSHIVILLPALADDFPVDAWRSAYLARLAWVFAIAFDLALSTLLAGLGDTPIRRSGRLAVSHGR